MSILREKHIIGIVIGSITMILGIITVVLGALALVEKINVEIAIVSLCICSVFAIISTCINLYNYKKK